MQRTLEQVLVEKVSYLERKNFPRQNIKPSTTLSVTRTRNQFSEKQIKQMQLGRNSYDLSSEGKIQGGASYAFEAALVAHDFKALGRFIEEDPSVVNQPIAHLAQQYLIGCKQYQSDANLNQLSIDDRDLLAFIRDSRDITSNLKRSHLAKQPYAIDKQDVRCYPLHLAIALESLPMVKYLVLSGASLTKQDFDGETPKSYCSRNPSKRRHEIFHYLHRMRKKQKLTLKDNDKNFPISLPIEINVHILSFLFYNEVAKNARTSIEFNGLLKLDPRFDEKLQSCPIYKLPFNRLRDIVAYFFSVARIKNIRDRYHQYLISSSPDHKYLTNVFDIERKDRLKYSNHWHLVNAIQLEEKRRSLMFDMEIYSHILRVPDIDPNLLSTIQAAKARLKPMDQFLEVRSGSVNGIQEYESKSQRTRVNSRRIEAYEHYSELLIALQHRRAQVNLDKADAPTGLGLDDDLTDSKSVMRTVNVEETVLHERKRALSTTSYHHAESPGLLATALQHRRSEINPGEDDGSEESGSDDDLIDSKSVMRTVNVEETVPHEIRLALSAEEMIRQCSGNLTFNFPPKRQRRSGCEDHKEDWDTNDYVAQDLVGIAIIENDFKALGTLIDEDPLIINKPMAHPARKYLKLYERYKLHLNKEMMEIKDAASFRLTLDSRNFALRVERLNFTKQLHAVDRENIRCYPLHLAIAFESLPMVKYLTLSGASLTQQDFDGETSESYCSRIPSEKRNEIFLYLQRMRRKQKCIEEVTAISYFEKLPLDLYKYIFSFLFYNEVAKNARVSSDFNRSLKTGSRFNIDLQSRHLHQLPFNIAKDMMIYFLSVARVKAIRDRHHKYLIASSPSHQYLENALNVERKNRLRYGSYQYLTHIPELERSKALLLLDEKAEPVNIPEKHESKAQGFRGNSSRVLTGDVMLENLSNGYDPRFIPVAPPVTTQPTETRHATARSIPDQNKEPEQGTCYIL